MLSVIDFVVISIQIEVNVTPEPESKNTLATVSLSFAWTLTGFIHIKTAWETWAIKHAPEELQFSEGEFLSLLLLEVDCFASRDGFVLRCEVAF